MLLIIRIFYFYKIKNFIKGETEDTVYLGSYTVCCEIDPENAKAVYKNGLLKIDVPFKEPEFKSIDITIQ